MAYSYRDFGSKSPGDTIVVDFPFLDREHVKVFVNGEEVDQAYWAWVTDGSIECLAGFPSGPGRVVRITPDAELEGRLVGTAVLDYPTINANFDQSLYILQERIDKEDDREQRMAALEAEMDSQEQTLLDHVEKGRKWAEETVDVPVETGQYSAKHHATKAAASASAASGSAASALSSANTASTKASEATSERLLAGKWAAENEDVQVAGGLYSARHYALKAAAALGNMISGLAGLIHGASGKQALSEDDEFALSDSLSSWGLKKVTLRDLRRSLGTEALNLLGDSGRFTTYDVKTPTISASFAIPDYLYLHNGTTAVNVGKFITNNNDYGGGSGNLPATVKDLIDKYKSASTRRYGVEFNVAEFTMGSGTSSSTLTVDGVTYYGSLFTAWYPHHFRQTVHMYVRAIDAPVVITREEGQTVFLDGVKQASYGKITPEDGWMAVTVWSDFPPDANIGYQPAPFLIRAAQSGHRYQVACLAIMPGLIEVHNSVMVIPSVTRFTYGVLHSTSSLQSFTSGFSTSVVDDGTRSSGTYEPNLNWGNYRKVTNGGAFTLKAPTTAGDYSMVVLITNSSSAGAITLSGFTRTTGDAFTTTNGHKFLVFITKVDGNTHGQVVRLQS